MSNKFGQQIEFKVLDLSAVDAYVTIDDEVELDKLYDFKMFFSSVLIELKLDISGILYKKNNETHKNNFILKFVNISNEKKIEIDEILKKRCIDKEVTAVNKCDAGGCELNKKK